MIRYLPALVLLFGGATIAAEVDLSDVDVLQFHKTQGEWAAHNGFMALRVTEPESTQSSDEDKLVIVDIPFTNGSIEVDISGEPEAGSFQGARGFVGVAFHADLSGSEFEAFYIRPTNGRAQDQLRRNHATQYIAYPDWPWHRLREETPGVYESYADLVPGQWTAVKITIDGDQGRLYLHDNEQPTLIINDLKLAGQSGAVALWIGPGTVAHFRNLRITAE